MIGQLPDTTIMDMLLNFGIGDDSSTFGLPHFTTPRYEMGVFKTGKIKMGFTENLDHCLQLPVSFLMQVR